MSKPSGSSSEGGSGALDTAMLKREIEALTAELHASLKANARPEPAHANAPSPDATDHPSLRDAAGLTAALESRIRAHPFAAVGLAMLAGYLAASIGRR